MASIPQVQIGGGSDARAGLVSPAVEIPSVDLSGPITLAQTLLQRAQEDEANKDSIRSVQLQEEYKRRSLDAISRLDPMAENYSDQVRQSLSEVQAGIMSETGITNRAISQNLELRLTAAVENDVTTSTLTRRTALAQTAIQTQDDLGNLALERIRDNPDQAGEILSEYADQSARLNSAIPPLKVAERAAIFGDAALQAQVEGLALAGRIAEAKALLAEDGGQLDPEVNRNMARRIREIYNIALADAQSRVNRTLADLEISVIDATNGSELVQLRSELEAMDARGDMPGTLQGTKVTLIRQIEAKQASLARDGKKLTEALTARRNGTLHKPEETDLAYEHEFDQMAAEHNGNPSMDTVIGHLAGFVGQTGRMPSRQKAFIENAEITTDPQQLASAALIDRRVREVAPTAETGAGNRVELTRALMEHVGLDAASAAQRVIEQAPDRPTAEARAKEFKEDIFPDFNATDFMNREVFGRGFIERNLPFFGTEEVTVPSTIARDAEETYALFYRMTGNADAAKTAAANAMKRKYGATSVGRSAPAAVKFPVERHYFSSELGRVLSQQPELQQQIITEDVEDALAQTLGFRATKKDGKTVIDFDQLNISDAPPGLESVPPYALHSDGQTEHALVTGQQPSWEIRVRDDYGNLVPLRIETPNGPVNLRLVAPTDDEVRAMPAWKERMKSEEDAFKLRRQANAELQKQGLMADPFFGEGDDPIRTSVPDTAVQEPNPIVAEVSRETPPPAGDKGPLPRGVRNMNPCNIERNRIVWQGMADDQSGDERFVIFSEPKFGIRACSRILKNYQDLHGLNTVSRVISRWAPASENQTKSYINSVAKALGVRQDQRIDLNDPMIMRGLIAGIIRHENGVQPYSNSLLDEAIQLSR